MSNGTVKVNGAQKNIVGGYTKVNGVWKTISTVSDKVSGVWKESWQNAFAMPSFLTYPSSITRGMSITWTVDSVSGAVYEYQTSYDGGKTWNLSLFSTLTTGNITITSDVTLNTFQMRIRAVAPTTHDKQSPWLIGPNRSLNAATLSAPTGLSYTSSITRGDKVRVYWNVDDVNINYVLRVTLNDGGNSYSDQIIFSNKVSKTGQTYFDYTLPTDVKWNWVLFKIYAQKTGYFDSPMTVGTTYQLMPQKLGAMTGFAYPVPYFGQTITISWDAVPNADQYQVEVNYGNGTSRIYWGPNRSITYTVADSTPSGGSGYIQFRVKATAQYYADGDWDWGSSVPISLPPLKATTWSCTATHNWRPNYGGQWDSNNTNLYQGEWTDSSGTWGNYKSIALFDYQNIKNTLAGRTISKVQIYLYRISTPHGYHSPEDVDIYTHAYASRPSGEPMLWFAQGDLGAYSLGTGSWITVSNVVAERIRDGQALGVGLYTASGDDYTIFSSGCMKLYVEYR